MELDELSIEIGEMAIIGNISIYRNEYAYLVFTLCDKQEQEDYLLQGDSLQVGGEVYKVTTVNELRSYQIEDFYL